MSTQFNRLRLGVWVTLVALTVVCLPFTVAALQHEPPPPVTPSVVPQPDAAVPGIPEELPAADPATACGETLEEFATQSTKTEVIFRRYLKDIFKNPDEYYGKTVTIDGEMHRQFTDRVFTVEDDG